MTWVCIVLVVLLLLSWCSDNGRYQIITDRKFGLFQFLLDTRTGATFKTVAQLQEGSAQNWKLFRKPLPWKCRWLNSCELPRVFTESDFMTPEEEFQYQQELDQKRKSRTESEKFSTTSKSRARDKFDEIYDEVNKADAESVKER